jgi:hypothetical protein
MVRVTVRLPKVRLPKVQVPKWLRGNDRAVLGIGLFVSAVSSVVGIAHLAWPWLAAVGCAVTAIATLATRALDAKKQEEKIRSLKAALAIACAVPVVAFLYHVWWDHSGSDVPASQAVVAGSGGAQIFYPYNEPDGTQGYTYSPIVTGETITLTCYVSLSSSNFWYRMAGNGGWIPRDALHAIPGIPFLDPPHCS